jgi:hypothetical protein
MAETISMPKLGFDMAEGVLVRWVKQEGENVNKGDVLAEIETDKATVEVESSASGVSCSISWMKARPSLSVRRSQWWVKRRESGRAEERCAGCRKVKSLRQQPKEERGRAKGGRKASSPSSAGS